MAGSTGVPSRRSRRTPASVLDRLPAWATTGVGSLPHTFPDHAAAHVTGEYDVPFCPQLPRLEGDMVGEWLGADPLRCGWGPERDRERPAAWGALLAALERRPPRHGVVKLQVTGPGHARPRPRARRRARRRGPRPRARPLAGGQRRRTGRRPARPRPRRAARRRRAGARRPPGVVRRLGPAARGCARLGPSPLLRGAVGARRPRRARPALVRPRRGRRAPPRRAVLGRLLARGGRVAWGVLAAHRPERAAHAAWRLSAALARLGTTADAVGDRSLLDGLVRDGPPVAAPRGRGHRRAGLRRRGGALSAGRGLVAGVTFAGHTGEHDKEWPWPTTTT